MDNRAKIGLAVAGFFTWGIWISGVFGNSGVLQAQRLSTVRHELRLKIAALENEKGRLQASLWALEHDSVIQEQAVRETLGFVRPNEIVFEFY